MKKCFTLCVMFLLAAVANLSYSQTAPLYNFSSYSLDSGTALTTGAVYRFSNVYTNVDAFVKVTGMSAGIILKDIDRTADGYQEAFQPEYRVSGSTNGYIDFRVTFVTHATSTVVSQPLVAATGLDIDGSTNGGTTLKEFNTIDMGNGVHEFNSFNSELIISQTGTAFTGANNTGVLYGALVDTSAKEVMYTVTSSNVTVLNYRVGANNQTTSTSTRYASLYFKKFTYQHFPLAISNLVSFEGVIKNNKVNLHWELSGNKYSRIELEKSYNAASFSSIGEYDLAIAEGNRQQFNYTDHAVTGKVVFYRLKSTTETGKTEYSNILSFRTGEDNAARLTVYPTVVRSAATVNINVPKRSNGLLQVTDLSGRTVKQQQLVLAEGTNNITISGFDSFLKGNYIVSVRTSDGLLSRQVIVQ